MNINYFDIHSHLYFDEFDSDRFSILESMKKEGIFTISIGTNKETSEKSISLAKENENIFSCIGVHPAHFQSDVFDKDFESLVLEPKVVALGECGFDYFRLSEIDSAKKIQKQIFESHIDLAVKNSKALMLHCRPSEKSMDAYEDTLNVLGSYKKDFGDRLFGNAHFFAGNKEILKGFLDIGFSVSFTGVITFTSDYNDLIKYTPDDMIHCETDSPFVAPVPFRGKRNSPLNVPFVVRKMAEIKNIKEDYLKEVLISNAKRLFSIDK